MSNTANCQVTFHLLDDQNQELAKFQLTDGDAPNTETFNGVDLTIAIEEGLAKCNGKHLFADVSDLRPPVEVAPNLYMLVSVKIPDLPVRSHPDGKTCGECKLFNHDHGVSKLKEITHKYQDGIEMCMNQEIIDHMASQHGKPVLGEGDIGFCPKNNELCSKYSPACEFIVSK